MRVVDFACAYFYFPDGLRIGAGSNGGDGGGGGTLCVIMKLATALFFPSF